MKKLLIVDNDSRNSFIFKVAKTILLTFVVVVLVGIFKGVSIEKVSIPLVIWLMMSSR